MKQKAEKWGGGANNDILLPHPWLVIVHFLVSFQNIYTWWMQWWSCLLWNVAERLLDWRDSMQRFVQIITDTTMFKDLVGVFPLSNRNLKYSISLPELVGVGHCHVKCCKPWFDIKVDVPASRAVPHKLSNIHINFYQSMQKIHLKVFRHHPAYINLYQSKECVCHA